MCVEFDSPVSIMKVKQTIEKLQEINLILIDYEKNNYVFADRALIGCDAANNL